MRIRGVARLARIASLLGVVGILGAMGLGACGGGGGEFQCDSLGSWPAGVVHGPQVALPSPTAMTIAWKTTSAVIGSVEYGANMAYGTTASELAATTDHEILLNPLTAATTYHYRIDDGGGPAGGDHTFTTPPSNPAASIRFAVVGDSGTGCSEEFAAVAAIGAMAPAFVLIAGDVAYDSGTTSEVQTRFLVPFAPLMRSVPVFPCLGNHDVKTANGQPLLDATVLPTNAADGTEHYYSFDWGPCHVIALDSNQDTTVGSLQRTWVESDLAAAAAAKWKFVFFHHPPYSSSAHGSDLALRASLGPVFDAHHVDIVFNGHDHDYERSFPMLAEVPTDAGSDPDYVDPAGTVYVVTGGGGQGLYAAGTSPFTAFSRSEFHVTQVDVAGGALTLTALLLDGTVLDRMTITKSP